MSRRRDGEGRAVLYTHLPPGRTRGSLLPGRWWRLRRRRSEPARVPRENGHLEVLPHGGVGTVSVASGGENPRVEAAAVGPRNEGLHPAGYAHQGFRSASSRKLPAPGSPRRPVGSDSDTGIIPARA